MSFDIGRKHKRGGKTTHMFGKTTTAALGGEAADERDEN